MIFRDLNKVEEENKAAKEIKFDEPNARTHVLDFADDQEQND
jgi:hypothetical protein